MPVTKITNGSTTSYCSRRFVLQFRWRSVMILRGLDLAILFSTVLFVRLLIWSGIASSGRASISAIPRLAVIDHIYLEFEQAFSPNIIQDDEKDRNLSFDVITAYKCSSRLPTATIWNWCLPPRCCHSYRNMNLAATRGTTIELLLLRVVGRGSHKFTYASWKLKAFIMWWDHWWHCRLKTK
jgi:hypothetical protein